MSKTVTCGSCGESSEVERGTEIFGALVVFGPDGEDDMYIVRDGEAKCKECTEDDLDIGVEYE